MRALFLSLLAAVTLASASNAQSPMPVVVPAMTPATTVKAPATPDNAAGSIQAAVKALQAMKAANEEILKQQAATLQKLDEIEKAATEIRIYTKRS
jgi:pectin methylesterase-like acyl-CoA thioesterase